MSDNERKLLAEQLLWAADECCPCDDGHHEWTAPYGTAGDARISRDDARRIASPRAGGVPGRSQAEIKAEALRQAADARRRAKEPGHWHLRDRFDAESSYSPDVWLEYRAARLD